MTADTVGGVWQYSIDLAESLVRQGARVMLATLGPRPSADQRRRAFEIPQVTLAESEFALEWMDNPWREVDAAGARLLALQSDFRADVIHLNGYAHAVLNWQRPVVVVAHSCVYSWWRAVHGCAPGPEWREYGCRVGAGLSAADLIVAPSVFMSTALQREYGVAAGKIQVIHNFSRAAPRSDAAKQPFVLAAGRIWDEAKNISVLEAIAPELDWEVRVAGSCGEAPPPGSAHFLGPLPHPLLMEEMARAAIFAHPALYEPFGLSVLEAARARCCLVLSDIPSLRELWDGAAVFLNPRDRKRWASELNALARDSTRRQVLGELAYSHAARYDAEASLSKYRQVYQSLIECSRHREKDVAA